MNNCEECKKSRHRTAEEKKYLQDRLKTIEGQIRGIAKMVEEDKYCNDILTQMLSVNKSIKSLSMDIFKSHLSSCVVDNIKDDNLEILDEVMNLVGRLN